MNWDDRDLQGTAAAVRGWQPVTVSLQRAEEPQLEGHGHRSVDPWVIHQTIGGKPSNTLCIIMVY